MATLPSYRRLNEQDYPPASQDLVKQLATSLNYGIEVLYSLLNGKLTFSDNIASTIKTFRVTVDSTGKPIAPMSIKKNTVDRILGLITVRADNITNSTIYPTSGVFISFTETTEALNITHITGLQANNIYELTTITIR